LDPHRFLGGELRLDRAIAERAISDRIAVPLGLSIVEAARAIVEIANQNLIGALRMITIQQGHDPRRFWLIAGGGAGPLHGSALARALGMGHVYVPRDAAVYSALGLLHADLRRDYVRSYFGELAALDAAELRQGFSDLWDQARREFEEMGVLEFAAEPALDLRYRGQHWEITVNVEDLDGPHLNERLAAAFHALHESRYAHQDPGASIEVLNLRLTAIARTAPREEAMPPHPQGKDPLRASETREVFLDERGPARSVPIFQGHGLNPGDSVLGPAVVEEPATTLFLAPGDRMEVDPWGNYLVHCTGD
jgi:N-methylhydantoinase A